MHKIYTHYVYYDQCCCICVVCAVAYENKHTNSIDDCLCMFYGSFACLIIGGAAAIIICLWIMC